MPNTPQGSQQNKEDLVSPYMRQANAEAALLKEAEARKKALTERTPTERMLIFLCMKSGSAGTALVQQLFPQYADAIAHGKQLRLARGNVFVPITLSELNEALLKFEKKQLAALRQNSSIWGPHPASVLAADLIMSKALPDGVSPKAVEIGLARILVNPDYAYNAVRTMEGPKRTRMFTFNMRKDRIAFQHPALRSPTRPSKLEICVPGTEPAPEPQQPDEPDISYPVPVAPKPIPKAE